MGRSRNEPWAHWKIKKCFAVGDAYGRAPPPRSTSGFCHLQPSMNRGYKYQLAFQSSKLPFLLKQYRRYFLMACTKSNIKFIFDIIKKTIKEKEKEPTECSLQVKR